MVLQCQSLHSLHLDLSPLYFALEGRITTVPSAHGDPEATPKFHLAEDIYSRVTPCNLENGLEDFVTRSSFYNFMKRIQNMKSLREFNLIGRASNEEQVIVPRPAGRQDVLRAFRAPPQAPAAAPAPAPGEVGAASLGYIYHTGLLPQRLKTEIFLPLHYGKASLQSHESVSLSATDAE
jgi:hypothetical protein